MPKNIIGKIGHMFSDRCKCGRAKLGFRNMCVRCWLEN